MNRYILISILLSLLFQMTIESQAHIMANSTENKNIGALMIVVNTLEVDDTILKINYEIRNDSKDDVWLLVGTCGYFTSAG